MTDGDMIDVFCAVDYAYGVRSLYGSSHEVNKQYKEAIDRLLMAFQYVYQSDASD